MQPSTRRPFSLCLILCILTAGRALSGGPLDPERLQYRLQWRGITAGEAVMERRSGTCQGQPCLVFESLAQSVPRFARIYQVRDQAISHYDPQRKRTLFSSKDLREGSYSRRYTARFDYTRRLIQYEEQKKENPPVSGSSPLPTVMLDMLSALYVARALPLKVQSGRSYEMQVFDDLKIVALEIRVLERGEQSILLNGQKVTFAALLIQPFFASTGIFRSKNPPLIWISDDADRLPLRILADVPLAGMVSAVLEARN